jgi:alpha-beta hydrolase superfamily lysophospholipase
MKKFLRWVGIGLGFLILLLLILPFLFPVPPLEDTVPVEELDDPDSQFMQVDGLRVHYKTYGQGEPVFILLHGFGASLFSWREVIGPLSQYGTVIAYDRPAFGLTERPLEWEGENPYSTQA